MNAQKKDKMMQSFEFGALAGTEDFFGSVTTDQRDTKDSS